MTDPSAVGPRSSVPAAYLDLLKLALCDLVGASTTSLTLAAGNQLTARELVGADRSERVEGRDWPAHALTMTGLTRLDDLQGLVEAIVRDGTDGDLVEAGSWRGGSSMLMRATLDVLGEADRTVWVCDSFAGFPPPAPGAAGWDNASILSRVPYLSVPLEKVRESFRRLGLAEGVEFVPGYFADTLAGLAEHRWALIRLDGDTFEATWDGLEALYPGLSPGGHVVIDDYGALEECRAAVTQFRAAHGISAPLHQVDWTCVRWQRPA